MNGPFMPEENQQRTSNHRKSLAGDLTLGLFLGILFSILFASFVLSGG